MNIRPVLALCALLLSAARGRAQSNQGGGVQLNPYTSLNSIISGGGTGAATPVDKVIVPVTPASDETAPASEEKDRPPKRPLRALKQPARKKLSDRALRRKIRGEIVHDVTLPTASRDVKVAAAAGAVTLTGTVVDEDDKYKIAAKAAELVGVENVVNLIEVKPVAAPR
jgi:hypothetical protein